MAASSKPEGRKRAPRSDARRNREALRETAGGLFRKRGIDVPLEDIARDAGVSIGTLYNHFPTRADLVTAVFVDHLRAGVEGIECALEIDDPWEAFRTFVFEIAERQAADRGFSDTLARGVKATPEIEQLRAKGYADMLRLIERAHAAGVLREDVSAEDLVFAAWGVGRTIERSAEISPELWRRFLTLLLDGFRAGATTELPIPPLGFDELQVAMQSQK